MLFPHPIEIRARRRRILLVAGVAVMLIGLLVCANLSNEPKYQGRYLSDWLADSTNPFGEIYDVPHLAGTGFSEKVRESQRAVRAIGTNAIPALLEMMEAKDSGLKRMWILFTWRTGWLQQVRSDLEKHELAKMGFIILQREAAPAVPQLIELTKSRDADLRLRALESLVLAGSSDYKALLPVLVSFGRDPDRENRERAASYVGMISSVLSAEELKQAGIYDAFPEQRATDDYTAHAK
jgi:hypothetical protein